MFSHLAVHKGHRQFKKWVSKKTVRAALALSTLALLSITTNALIIFASSNGL
jgi:hypothetical protein